MITRNLKHVHGATEDVLPALDGFGARPLAAQPVVPDAAQCFRVKNVPTTQHDRLDGAGRCGWRVCAQKRRVGFELGEKVGADAAAVAVVNVVVFGAGFGEHVFDDLPGQRLVVLWVGRVDQDEPFDVEPPGLKRMGGFECYYSAKRPAYRDVRGCLFERKKDCSKEYNVCSKRAESGLFRSEALLTTEDQRWGLRF